MVDNFSVICYREKPGKMLILGTLGRSWYEGCWWWTTSVSFAIDGIEKSMEDVNIGDTRTTSVSFAIEKSMVRC